MQIFIAKYRFHDGAIVKFDAIKPIMSEGWLIQLTTKDGQKYVVETARGEQKVYLKMDSLINDVERITGRVTSLSINI